MASDICLRTNLIVRKETRCHHIGYSYRLTARVLLYAPSHRQDCTYHSLCYTSRGALAGMRNSSRGSPHEGSIRRPIATMSECSYHGATSHSPLENSQVQLVYYFAVKHSCKNYQHHTMLLSHIPVGSEM